MLCSFPNFQTLIDVIWLENNKNSITREGILDIGFNTSWNMDVPHASAPATDCKDVAPVTGKTASLMKVG